MPSSSTPLGLKPLVSSEAKTLLTFTTFSLWLHIGAIVVWVGGLFAVSFVFVPVLWRGVDSPQEAARLVAAVMGRFQRISREIIFLILVTGIFNFMNAGIARGFQFGGIYLSMLAIKVILFVAIIAVQAWQSFRLVPRMVAVTTGMEQASATRPGAVKRLERLALITSLVNSVMGISVILLGLMLRYR